ncbi:MAG TPA: uroporphyrinogen-III synthase [Candidatus Polarisedimenticolia bacterium]|nr:uroporphyrinogen-III synthase [Candidatus Polarisedimenticolia bacterium]
MNPSTGPLAGKKVLVTRAEEGEDRLTGLLSAQGAEVIHIPLVRFEDPPSWEPLMEAAARLESFDRALFTSATAVDRFFARLHEFHHSEGLPDRIIVSAVGPKTTAALERAGCHNVQHAATYRAEGLLDLLPESEVAGQKILFPRALEARELLVEELRRRGAKVCLVPVYRTVKAEDSRDALLSALRSRSLEVVTFTSASAVRHFVDLADGADLPGLLQGTRVACLGEVTAQATHDGGIHPDIVPSHATLEELVGAIVRELVR